jgi:predicted O-methyltransferase YrrM
MTSTTTGRPELIHAYIERLGFHEPDILARLRAETAPMPNAGMQIAPEQGAVLGLLVEVIGARRCLEIGTFTGYSSIAIALAMPVDGMLVCCDISEKYTAVARRYWAEAGVTERVDLRLGPAVASLDALLAGGAAGTFDLAFVDADKPGYPAYWERCVELVRPGGLIVLDNVLFHDTVVDPGVQTPETVAIRATNELVAADDRVRHVLLGIADGMTIARKR